MDGTFTNKKTLLLSELRMLALRHNRDYYVSLIPYIERVGPEDTDLIDMYQAAIYQDRTKLAQSRQALKSIPQITTILAS